MYPTGVEEGRGKERVTNEAVDKATTMDKSANESDDDE